MREVRDRYEIFLKVCETGNFTKAAEALNYTQSGISQMMGVSRRSSACSCSRGRRRVSS